MNTSGFSMSWRQAKGAMRAADASQGSGKSAWNREDCELGVPSSLTWIVRAGALPHHQHLAYR